MHAYQAFFAPAAFQDCPPIPIPVPKLPNPPTSDDPIPAPVDASPVVERNGRPEGPAVVGGRPEKPGRKELVGMDWIDKNLLGGGRSSLLCCERKGEMSVTFDNRHKG